MASIMKLLILSLLSLFLIACGNDSSTSANNLDGEISSKSSSSQKTVSSSSDKVTEAVNPADVIVGSMTDSRDGQNYKTVTIGFQTWMAENLNYETENSYCYDDKSSNCAKYGRLYTWASAMDSAGVWSTNGKGCGYGSACSPSGIIRGVCPKGWHLPNNAEWKVLLSAVGDSLIAGLKIKSTFGWREGNGKSGNGIDAFGFSALPAGYRHDSGMCYYEEDYAHFWSSTEDSSNDAYLMFLYYRYDYASINDVLKYYGFSVRCLKD